jgi:hypothetical protein
MAVSSDGITLRCATSSIWDRPVPTLSASAPTM